MLSPAEVTAVQQFRAKVALWDAAYAVFVATEVLIAPLVLTYPQYSALRAHERRIAIDIERDGIRLWMPFSKTIAGDRLRDVEQFLTVARAYLAALPVDPLG
ncbi:MAG: hypothetical protein HY696_11040 [Deltaproteobacteria bacterium]|nr:hypothetical protein [Deltaproteobacteria bacterium]